ncbi:MAG: TetR/AcrR family transcriptional regulator [Spirochaetes bacterium]|nr:TetR/AcrR family transcriptional regulator [Spirochaetota bacterium]
MKKAFVRRPSAEPASPAERIVTTATRLFESQGYAATGINQIIAESKTAKASFYDHYPSKELLGKEYLARYGANHLALIRTLMDRSGSPAEFIHSWVRILKRQLKLRKFYGCPMSNLRAQTADSSPLLKAAVKDLADSTIELIASYIRTANPGGLFAAQKTATLAARRIFSAYEGAIHIWQLTGDEAALDDIGFMAEQVLKSRD